MTALELLEAIAGGVLLFALPGFGVSRALFPEWRFRGPGGARHALETATLSFVLSIALTVLVGSAILGLAPGGFSAAWGNPLLEAILAGVAAIALGVGAAEGAFSARVPARALPLPEPGGEAAWELTRALDRLHREEERLARRLARSPPDAPDLASLRDRIAELHERQSALARDREEAYAR